MIDDESVREQRDSLLEALAELEADIETPCVPGELEGWIGAANDAFQRVQPLLDRQIHTVHPQQFSEISEEDEELLRRVEQMRQEDAGIAEAAGELREQIQKLETAAANIEPDEARFRTAFDDFVQAGLKWIIRVRTQEQAIRTWLMEAFTRDRGPVD
jgi:hypothetical protein